ncbi:hypothetical protein EDC04DRAFT_2598872 [Pisolithus marmoratus]|nr:hypothetical protein EDC04DRAFT_2598872 [Pisolithus marmoratus]
MFGSSFATGLRGWDNGCIWMGTAYKMKIEDEFLWCTTVRNLEAATGTYNVKEDTYSAATRPPGWSFRNGGLVAWYDVGCVVPLGTKGALFQRRLSCISIGTWLPGYRFAYLFRFHPYARVKPSARERVMAVLYATDDTPSLDEEYFIPSLSMGQPLSKDHGSAIGKVHSDWYCHRIVPNPERKTQH